MDIYIIGAGMAGLLAARMLKARGHHPMVIEAQKELPNNHHAVLRFRSNVVSEVTGIPFTKVNMIKCTVPYRNPVAEALAYSYKATGTHSTDRSITHGHTVAERWIAPGDFITQLAEGLDIKYGQPMPFDGRFGYGDAGSPIISTIPMPKLVPLLQYTSFGDVERYFNYRHGYVGKAKVHDCNAYASIYIPDHKYECYRASITGDDLSVEYAYEPMNQNRIMKDVLELFGLDVADLTTSPPFELHQQPYGKIEPIDDDQRKRFISWATDQRNIYSLGRFATWRPGLLLDDLVNDIKRIEQWIVKNNNYDRRK